MNLRRVLHERVRTQRFEPQLRPELGDDDGASSVPTISSMRGLSIAASWALICAIERVARRRDLRSSSAMRCARIWRAIAGQSTWRSRRVDAPHEIRNRRRSVAQRVENLLFAHLPMRDVFRDLRARVGDDRARVRRRSRAHRRTRRRAVAACADTVASRRRAVRSPSCLRRGSCRR